MGAVILPRSKCLRFFKNRRGLWLSSLDHSYNVNGSRSLHYSFPCRSQTIDMSYNVYDSKDCSNPPIVIMHGVLGSKTNWNSLSKALNKSTSRKVYAVDARNHGDSLHTDEFSYHLMAGDVIRLLDTQKLDRVCLIGHSMGGRTMMRTALSYPARVEKLVVVDISPIQLSSTLAIDRYLDLFDKITLNSNLPLSQGRRIADEQLKENVPEDDIRLFLLANLTKTAGEFKWKANIKALKDNFRNIVEFPLSNEVFDKPVLFIGGTKSDYLKPEDEDKIRSYFPQAVFRYLPTGHWVHAEQPAAFLKLTTDFINGPS